MSNKQWYGARTVYDAYPKQEGDKIYEERVVILQAVSFDEAINEAEKEAVEYANDAGMTYLGYVNVFEISDGSVGHKTEVYSLMRGSPLRPSDYLDSFFDTGAEKTRRRTGVNKGCCTGSLISKR